MLTVYTFPRKTIFGVGAAQALAQELPASGKILLVLGSHAAKDPEVLSLIPTLTRYSPVIHVGVPAEPPLSAVDLLIEKGRAEQVSAVVAIGGGSVLDAAKSAAALIPLDGTVSDYFSGAKEIPGKGLFFAALPTTAGTGSESTNNAVLTDVATKEKKSLRHPSMVADLALIDPNLTLSCPPSLSAASGLDAFVQAFESYTSPRTSSLTRAIAGEGAKKILQHLERVCSSPSDLNSRIAVAEGSMLSGMAFSQTGLGGIHGLAHPIGSLLHVPHGLACAILMPFVMTWNRPSVEKEYAELALICGVGSTADDFIRAAGRLAETLNVPSDFASYGLSGDHADFIVRHCRSASMKQNPRPFSDSDVRSLIGTLLSNKNRLNC